MRSSCRPTVAAVVLWCAWHGAPAPAADPLPRIAVAGTLRFPDEAVAGDGTRVAVTGVSGVTWLGNDGWVAVADTGAVLVTFALDLEADGAPRAIRDPRAVRLSARHDYEDVAPCPRTLTQRLAAGAPAGRCLVVCEEDTPAIHVVAADGAIVGAVPIPACLANRRPNRGLESLAAAADGAALWTANEEALPDDGPSPAPGSGTVVRIVELPLAAAAPPGRQIAYAVDPPHASVPVGGGEVYSGVVALAALPDGRLLVLERSAVRGLPAFENRLFIVDPAAAEDVAGVARNLAGRPDAAVAKRLVWRGALGCNLEGLAVGPSLAAGGRALVAVADAGGLDAPSQIVVLRMDAEVTSP